MGLNAIVKYLSIGLAIILISSTSSALTIEGSLYTDPAGEYVYNSVLDHKEEIVYEQSKANVPLIQEVKNKRERKHLNKVAGRDLDGYSKLIIKKLNDKNVLIQVDRQEYHHKEAIDLQYEVHGVFTNGTWEDLINDRSVVIALTEESKAASKRSVKVYLEQLIMSIANQNKAARFFGGFKDAHINKDSFLFNAPILEGTKRALSQKFQIRSDFRLD